MDKLELSQTVSRETLAQLELYVEQLLKWQKRINFVSPDSIPSIWSRHISDSTQLISMISGNTKTILDVGSGGGLPAIPLAIASKTGDLDPCQILMVESDSRKSVFLKQLVRLLKLDAQVENKRIENLEEQEFDLITCRAFRSLTDIFDLLQRFAHTNTSWILPKGRNWKAEIDEASAAWQFTWEAKVSATNPDSMILLVSQVSKLKA